VFVTGCPSIDLAKQVAQNPALDFNPIAKYGGVGELVTLEEGYIVVMQHPVTTEHQEARDQTMETLHAINRLEMPVFWFWPNVDAGSDGTSNAIRSFREGERPRWMHFFKNMEPTDFLRLIYNSRCLVGNSSVGIRECSYLGVPVVNIGTRQAGRERGGNVIDVDYDRGQIDTAIARHLANGRCAPNPLYGDGRAGESIADVLATAELRIEKRLAY
jgi:bifunctional UDP-N-acetylglucosamine 2-epimerase / N-acetylmannosamine kinase